MSFLHLTLFNVQSTDWWQLWGSIKGELNHKEVTYVFMNSKLCPKKRLRNHCSNGFFISMELPTFSFAAFIFWFFYFLLTWSKALENKRKHSLSCAHLPQQCQPLLWVIKNELCCGIETWFGLVLQKSLHHLNLMRFTFLFVSPLLIFFFSPILSR